MDMQMVPGQGPEQTTTRAELVAIVKELRNLLLTIDAGTFDRRYVDFRALADRLDGCITAIEET